METGKKILKKGVQGTVLIIEDNADDRRTLESFLRQSGFDVYTVSEFDASLSAARNIQPVAILLSADMKGGFNLCHNLKKDERLKRIPLILIFQMASAETIRKHKLLPTRADAYVEKPVTREVLINIVKELLQGQDIVEREDYEDLAGQTMKVRVSSEAMLIEYLENELKNLKGVVKKLEDERTELVSKITSLEQSVGSQAEKIDSGLKVLLERQKSSKEQNTELQTSTTIKRLEKESVEPSELVRLRRRVAELENEVKTLREGRETDEETLDIFERLEAGYKHTISTLTKENKELEEKVILLEAELQRYKSIEGKEMFKTKEMVSALEKERDELKERVDALKSEVEQLRRDAQEKTSVLVDLQNAREEIHKLREEIGLKEDVEKRLEEVSQNLKNYEAKVVELTAENNALRNEMSFLKEQVDALQGIREAYEKIEKEKQKYIGVISIIREILDKEGV